MKPEPSIFDIPDEDADERAMLEGEADIAAGRFVPHDKVVEWLKTWGTPDEKPAPPEWFE